MTSPMVNFGFSSAAYTAQPVTTVAARASTATVRTFRIVLSLEDRRRPPGTPLERRASLWTDGTSRLFDPVAVDTSRPGGRQPARRMGILTMASLEERLKEHARSLGLPLAGIAPAAEADDFGRLREWLARGFGGAMGYMARHADARRHPASVLPAVRSVVMVGMDYAPIADCRLPIADCGGATDRQSAIGNRQSGKVARYARGPD